MPTQVIDQVESVRSEQRIKSTRINNSIQRTNQKSSISINTKQNKLTIIQSKFNLSKKQSQSQKNLLKLPKISTNHTYQPYSLNAKRYTNYQKHGKQSIQSIIEQLNLLQQKKKTNQKTKRKRNIIKFQSNPQELVEICIQLNNQIIGLNSVSAREEFSINFDQIQQEEAYINLNLVNNKNRKSIEIKEIAIPSSSEHSKNVIKKRKQSLIKNNNHKLYTQKKKQQKSLTGFLSENSIKFINESNNNRNAVVQSPESLTKINGEDGKGIEKGDEQGVRVNQNKETRTEMDNKSHQNMQSRDTKDSKLQQSISIKLQKLQKQLSKKNILKLKSKKDIILNHQRQKNENQLIQNQNKQQKITQSSIQKHNTSILAYHHQRQQSQSQRKSLTLGLNIGMIRQEKMGKNKSQHQRAYQTYSNTQVIQNPNNPTHLLQHRKTSWINTNIDIFEQKLQTLMQKSKQNTKFRLNLLKLKPYNNQVSKI